MRFEATKEMMIELTANSAMRLFLKAMDWDIICWPAHLLVSLNIQ